MITTLHTPHGSLLQGALAVWRQAMASALRPAVPKRRVDSRTLHSGQTIEIEQPCRQEIVCLMGTLWITHDRRPEDTILERGGRYVAACDSRMLVHAMSDARMAVVALRA